MNGIFFYQVKNKKEKNPIICLNTQGVVGIAYNLNLVFTGLSSYSAFI